MSSDSFIELEQLRLLADESYDVSEESEEDEDEDNLLPIAYADRHGLVRNHRHENPFQAVDIPPPCHTLHADFEDPEGSQKLGMIVCMNALKGNTVHEKWDVDRQTVDFLASVFALENEIHCTDICELDGPTHLNDLKLEDAILPTDPDLDISRLKERNKVRISTAGMKPFVLNDKKGESFAWSDEAKRTVANMDRGLSNEKLNVDLETMEYLREIVSLGNTADEEMVDTIHEPVTARLPRLETPPLLPLSPPLSPAGLPTSAGTMEFTSTPEDLCAVEARQLQRSIMARDDADFLDTPTSEGQDTDSHPKELYRAIATPDDSSSSPLRRKGVQDLEVDVPLLPTDTMESPVKKAKRVSFPSDIQIIIPDTDMILSDPDEDIETFINEVVTPLAESVIQEAENEELIEINTTMRVPVPQIDEIELLPPWNLFPNGGSSRTSQQSLLSSVKRDLTKGDAKWSGVSKVERLLSWSPFPARLGKVQLDETFDDGSLAEYMAEMSFGGLIDVESLVCKPEGLRILKAQETDGEELQSAEIDQEIHEEMPEEHQPPTPVPPLAKQHSILGTLIANKNAREVPAKTDMQALLRKRKLELEGASTDERHEKRPNLHATESRSRNDVVAQPTKLDNLGKGGGGLSDFMKLHGRELQKDAHSATDHQLPNHREIVLPVPVADAIMEDKEEQGISLNPLEAPEMKTVDQPISIVISSDLSANRQLIRQIQSKLPTMDVIEREPIHQLDSNAQLPSKNINTTEADITISPSTGLIITTLQKLKQKPLPGQSTFFGVRERIETVAARYERLVVFISEARYRLDSHSPITSSLEESDAEAHTDFTGFVALLNTDVEVYFVAGGESELVRWIAAFISKRATSHPDAKLIHDETLWERFLRHAGLNAFAAQAVLAKFKMSDISDGDRSSATAESVDVPPYGLTAFMQMTAKQRIEQCGPFMGSDRVLQRVNDLIDGGWMSASAIRR